MRVVELLDEVFLWRLLVLSEFCFQGCDLVEYLLLLDVPARDSSFNSHFGLVLLLVSPGEWP